MNTYLQLAKLIKEIYARDLSKLIVSHFAHLSRYFFRDISIARLYSKFIIDIIDLLSLIRIADVNNFSLSENQHGSRDRDKSHVNSSCGSINTLLLFIGTRKLGRELPSPCGKPLQNIPYQFNSGVPFYGFS